MSKNVSNELRKALDDPAARYRIVDAWLLLQKKEALQAMKAAKESHACTVAKQSKPK